MPLRDLDRLRSMMGGFVDATNIIRGLRMVKSEREIEKHVKLYRWLRLSNPPRRSRGLGLRQRLLVSLQRTAGDDRHFLLRARSETAWAKSSDASLFSLADRSPIEDW